MLELPARKSVHLDRSRYLGRRLYFVTICCFQRKKIFLNSEIAHWLLGVLRAESAARCFNIHAYCVMPDHLHFLAEGMEPGSGLLRFVKSFKIKTSRQFAQKYEGALWQKDFYEHILRLADSVEAVSFYVWLNPVRAGLVDRPQGYAHVGSFSGSKMPAAWGTADWCPPWKKLR